MAKKKSEMEQALVDSILKYSDDAILSKTPEGNILSWNPAAERIFGYSPKEIIGKHISILIPTHLQFEEHEIMSKILKGERVDHYETERMKKGGEIIQVSLTISPLMDSAGNIIGVSKICSDITKRLQTEQILESGIKEILDYKEALDESAIVAITDQKGIIKHVNDNFCKISKYSKEELIGQDHRIINSGYHPKAFIKELWTTIANGKIWKGELKNKAKDGTIYWVDTTIVPFLNEAGKPQQYLAIRSDITERKRAVEAILDYKEALDESAIVAITDQKGIIKHVNDNFCKISKYSKGELIGQDHRIINSGYHSKAFIKELWTTIANGEIWKGELKNKAKDGTIYWVDTTIVPFLSEEGKPYQYLAIRSDITERKKAEEQLVSSEERFRYTLDNMLEGIQIHDFNWKYIYVNDTLAKYSKCSKEDLLGYTLMEKYPGIEETDLFKLIEKCMKERVAQHLETEFVFPDGSKADFELSMQPVPEGVFMLSIDITERKKVELKIKNLNEELEQKVIDRTQELLLVNIELESKIQQLKVSEESILASQKIFSTIFYKSPVMNTITDADNGNFIEVNDRFIEFTGLKKEEVIGKSSIDLNMIVEPSQRTEILNMIKEKGYSKDILMEMKAKNDIRWVSTSAHPVNIGGLDCYITAMVDVTKRKRVEEQLESVNKELEAFSYSVSHDLRAPLRAVNGYAEMLKEDFGSALNEEGKRIIETIRYNAKKMGVLIDDLLGFSRLGRKEVQKVMVDMNVLTEGVILELNKSMPHHAEIIVGKLHKVKADYGLLNQVMYNLVSNAVKYSSKKEHPVVEIFSEEKNSEIIFTIKDNGAGFDMKYVNKLFGVFQRLHSQEEFEGTGVGLAIVQRIIAKHGGKIWAEGILNKGSVFKFSITKQKNKNE